MTKKIHFGFLGFGKITQADHLPALKSLADRAEVSAVFDPEPGKAEARAAEFGISPKICASQDELLAQDIDAVIIAAPNVFHYPQAIAALKAGKHVLVEKPMSFTTAQADEMIDLSLKKGLVLQVNQSRRYNPLMTEAKKCIDEGLIGDILHFRSQRTMVDSPEMLWSPGASWFTDPKFEGSLVGDIAVHMSDAMDWFCGPAAGLSAVTRKAKRKVEDVVFALINYRSGAVGTLELSWNFPGNYRSDEIYGTKGALRLQSNGLAFEFIPAGSKQVTELITAQNPHSYRSSHACFLDAVEAKSTTAWEFGRNAVSLVEALRNSGAADGQVAIPNYRKK